MQHWDNGEMDFCCFVFKAKEKKNSHLKSLIWTNRMIKPAYSEISSVLLCPGKWGVGGREREFIPRVGQGRCF